ncbi:MAG: hypothetical protein ACRC1H_14955 [Caldilineaceae bacterium]
MGFLKRLFGSAPSLDGALLAASPTKSEYAQIHLLMQFDPARPLHGPADRQRWSRVLPQPYDETIGLFVKQGWLAQQGDLHGATPVAAPFLAAYRSRLDAERAEVMPRVRQALLARDTSEALEIRRAYEARAPLGEADWTGPEPQMSHSALTRRILFMNHWLLDGISPQSAEWLKFYAAEQHLWGAPWRLPEADIPPYVAADLAAIGMGAMSPAEAAFHKAQQLALQVENHETWQRCKGGDHVRRIKVVGPDDEFTCDICKAVLGKEYLVLRTPELPHRGCTSPHGCRCMYEPVLESFDEQQGKA